MTIFSLSFFSEDWQEVPILDKTAWSFISYSSHKLLDRFQESPKLFWSLFFFNKAEKVLGLQKKC